jgi:prepilin-type N-terminal cleavage/methylation domain-containing protein
MQMARAMTATLEPTTSTRGARPRERAFTLIELLVVVAIIGILSAIAIPQFSAYRERAMRALVESDARNAASAQEAYYVDFYTYAGDCGSLPGYSPSENVTCTATGGATAFTITTTHTISGYSCTWVSNPGAENMSCS